MKTGPGNETITQHDRVIALGRELLIMRYNDAHVHFGQRGEYDPQAEAVRLIQDMDENHLDRVFLFPIGATIERNEAMIEAIEGHRDRFIPFAWMDPTAEGQLEYFTKALGEGRVCGLKLHPYSNHYHIDDFALVDPWMRVVAEAESHVIIHCTSGDEFGQPDQIARLAERWPQVTFQMAHLGAIWKCSEGTRLVAEHENLYGDTSITSYSASTRAVHSIADRLLMGTDYPFYRFQMEQLKLRLATQGDEALIQKVCHDNFEKIAARIDR